ncbi:hypothetical protein [Virgibacillus halodenitrificans]|uniref:hypothetical protein n=1 Tax=Virgibacillus halodenitrificans TaxID=1482 RepID=UPI0007619194
MDKFNLNKFVTEEIIRDTSKELLASKNESICYEIIKGFSIGQLEKLKTFLSCQTKEMNNSLSFLSLFVATLAVSIP